jgi:membrane protease YdiL (CAAX protease family)
MRVKDVSKHSLDLILLTALIILAESLLYFGNMKAAMAVHAITLTLLILSAVYLEDRMYIALMLLPLFRLLNVAMPVFFQLTIYSYSLVYAPMFIPMYFIVKEKIFSRSEIGLTTKGFWFYLPLAIAVGFALGWGEYNVLRPGVLIPDFGWKSILILSITMILFVGVVEEFVFRSVLQTEMEGRLGSIAGLISASILFGFMHSGYHLPQEILYVSFAGVVFGLLFWLTKSLPVIAVAHGVTNISLFLVLPAYSGMLIFLIAIPGLVFLIYASISKKMPRKLGPRNGRNQDIEGER